jgi:hypothetical protein
MKLGLIPILLPKKIKEKEKKELPKKVCMRELIGESRSLPFKCTLAISVCMVLWG